MKKHIYFNVGILLGSLILMVSCKYQRVVPANYPDQKLYIANASIAKQYTSGIYTINKVDVPGQVTKYNVAASAAKFNALVGVVRSGINADGDVSFNITATTDTITKLITKGTLTATDVLPATAYSLASTASISSGQTSVTFPLVIDLNFLLANIGKKYALAVSIQSDKRVVSSDLGTLILVIDPSFLIPTANFNPAVDGSSSKKINFTNTSANGVSYSWDFGDGSAIVTDTNTSHTYAASGSYSITLTTTGATGDAQKVQKTIKITVN